MSRPQTVSRLVVRVVASLAAVAAPTGCDSEDDLQPEDFGDADAFDPDDVEHRWATPLTTVETMVTSANAANNGQNPGCWDTSPSGSPRTFQQYPCHARNNQRWKFEAAGILRYRIHSADDDGLCVEVPDGNAVGGQDLQIAPCDGGFNQLWDVRAVSGTTSATIHPAADFNLCMNVENATITNQSRIQVYPCTAAINERWRFHNYLDDDTIGGCSGSVRFYSTPHPASALVGPGGVGNFPVSTNTPNTYCSSDYDQENVKCPAGSDWIVADRLGGTGTFKVRCFDTN